MPDLELSHRGRSLAKIEKTRESGSLADDAYPPTIATKKCRAKIVGRPRGRAPHNLPREITPQRVQEVFRRNENF